MAYDAWKQDVDGYLARFDEPKPHPDDDVLLWAVPRYRVHVFRDRGLRLQVARIERKRAPREPWQKLEECVISLDGVREDDAEALVVRQLLANRRYLRSCR